MDRQARGCDGSKRWKVGTGYVWGCPNKLFTEEIGKGIEAWVRWKRFGWPYAGGWAEQDARYFDIVEAVEGEFVAVENRRIEKAQSGNSNR